MTVNLASYSAPCNIRVITNTFQKRPLKNLVFLRQFNFYRLPERSITLSKFNLKITSWKEEFTGSGTAPFAQGTQLKIHFHYSGCYTNQLGSLGRQSVILQAKVLYSLVLFPSSLGRITDFFLFSWKQISWPQVYWCQGQRKKLATNPSTTFPPACCMTWKGLSGTVDKQPALMYRTLYNHFKGLTSKEGISLTVLHTSTGSLLQFRCKNCNNSWRSSSTLKILN